MATGRYVHRFDIDDEHSVHIYQGSLVEVQADALVSSDNNYLTASQGVSAALAEFAGPDVARERERARSTGLQLGDIVRTSPGRLSCQHFYHAITCDLDDCYLDEADVRRVVTNLLARAKADGIRSLGMPALGTGAMGFELRQAAQVIIEELIVGIVDTPVRHVILALIGDESERLFYEELFRANVARSSAAALRRREQKLLAAQAIPADPGTHEIEANGPDGRGALQIRVVNCQQIVYSQEFAGPVELGRQIDFQESLYSARPMEAGYWREVVTALPDEQKKATEELCCKTALWRAVVAQLNEDSIPRHHALLELLDSGRVRVSNVSAKVPIRLATGQDLMAGKSCELSLPTHIVLGRKTVRITVSGNRPAVCRLAAVGGSTGDLGQYSLGGLEPTVSSQKVAQAVVDLGGCDCGAVLLWRDGDWKMEALFQSPQGKADPHWRPSQNALARVRDEKATFWQSPDDSANTPESLMGVENVVAAPILDREGQVIGAVYGDCVLDNASNTCDRITKREATLVEWLASRVAMTDTKPEGSPLATVGDPGQTSLGGAQETGQQFPSLVDDLRLATLAPEQPKLVAGLAGLILKYAETAEVEEELLKRPECRGFRGTVEQRLMEFLYISERNLRIALGPALFRTKDLRHMAEELGEDTELIQDADQLTDRILRALCFNLSLPPTGLTQYLARAERLVVDLGAHGLTDIGMQAIALEAGKILEQVLKDLLCLYGWFFFGPGFDEIAPVHRAGKKVSRFTVGQARESLVAIEAHAKKDQDLRARFLKLGREEVCLLPERVALDQSKQTAEREAVLGRLIKWRNETAHGGDSPPTAVGGAVDPRPAQENLELLRAFLLACRTTSAYPEVLRYEGTFANRSGERFVYFLDERNTERKVRTDEKIDPRRHYYCFATNNPVHLFPVLIPKL